MTDFLSRVSAQRQALESERTQRERAVAHRTSRASRETQQLTELQEEVALAVRSLAREAKEAYVELGIAPNLMFEQSSSTSNPFSRLGSLASGRKAASQSTETKSGWALTRQNGNPQIQELMNAAGAVPYNSEHGLFLDKNANIRPYYASGKPVEIPTPEGKKMTGIYKPLDDVVGNGLLVPRIGLDLDILDIADQPAMQYWTAVFEAVAIGRHADNIALASFLDEEDPRG